MTMTLADINRELMQRARTAELDFDCGASGIFNANIAIIGEYPGEREKQLKMPLCGGSGKFLWDVLRKYNVTRQNFYVTNVVKRRVVEDDGGNGKLSRGELEHWKNLLYWELSCLPNLKYILVLGGYALEAVTGEIGITKWRGSVLNNTITTTNPDHSVRLIDVQTFCAINPAFVLREPRNEIVFRFDMDKFWKMVSGNLIIPKINHIINPSYNEAMEWIKMMQGEKLPTSLDIEVIGTETACVGLTNRTHEGMCINFRTMSENNYSLQEEKEIRLALQEFVIDPETKIVAQNGSFDSYWLWYKDRIRIRRIWFDTLLAHHTLYPPLPHNLGFLTSQYTNHPYYKDDGKTWKEGGDIDAFWEYNVKDVCITLSVYQKEIEELRAQNLDKFYFNHVMRLQPHLVRMTVHGVKCDIGLKQQIACELHEEIEKLSAVFVDKCREATCDPEYTPNYRSPKQMSELYFKRLKLVGRGPKCDKENRKRMRDHPRTTALAREILDLHDKIAKEDKFLGTYAESEVDIDGRLRCEYKQYGVAEAPGRLSSTQTLWGSGMNLQNQPERAKKMFIADGPIHDVAPEGYVFVYFDLAQVEARFVGWLAPVPLWIEQFERARADGSYDAHRALASVMYKVPYDEVPKEDWNEDGTPTIRYKAKRCRHGLNYRMSAPRLADTAGMSIAEAEKNYVVYHRTSPEVKQWWDNTVEEVKKHRELWTVFGRRWILLERLDEQSLTSIIAFRPQSMAGDHVSSVIYKCHEDEAWPKKDELHLDAAIILNIHDALIALTPVEHHKTVMKIMKKHAEAEIVIGGRPLIVPADFAVSQPDDKGVHRWSTLKKIKDFNGYVNS